MTDEIRSRILAVAASEEGNTDPSRYWLDVLPVPDPDPRDAKDRPLSWCGAFTLWCLHRAGVGLNVKWRGGYLATACRLRAPHEKPQPGDLGYLTQHQHHCVVEWFDESSGIVGSIDGNSGLVQGGVVTRNQRPRTRFAGFYDPAPLFGGSAPAAPKTAPKAAPLAPLPPAKTAPTSRPAEHGAEVARPVLETSGLTLGLDVSSHQAPGSVDWAAARRAGFEFVYVRACDGIDRDVHAEAHVRGARAAGLAVGLYGFFVPWRGPGPLFAALERAHVDLGIGDGDLAPCVDVESWGDRKPPRIAAPSWVEHVRDLLTLLSARFGAATRYHSPSDWHLMGRPTRLDLWPLWLADYTGPADLPGWIAWQHAPRVHPGVSAAPLDWSEARELPRIATGPALPGPAPIVHLDDQQVAALAADAAMRGIR